MYAYWQYCKKNTFVHLNNVTFLGHIPIKKNWFNFFSITFWVSCCSPIWIIFLIILCTGLVILYYYTHTHTRHQTSLQPYLYVPSTEPSLHLFHSEGDLKRINNLQEIYKVLNVITLNVYKNSNLPRAFKQECTPPSPYAWHISLFQKSNY